MSLYQELMSFSNESDDEIEHNSGVLDGPKLFEGDAFGGPEDYMDEDFGQNDVVLHGQLPELIDDPDDEEDDMLTAGQDAVLEAGWEPERPGASVDVTAAVQADSSDAPLDPELTDVQRQQAEGRLNKTFTMCYSDKYPTHGAGAALKQKQPHDDKYSAAINGLANPWAPFSSRIDWEIAKWAKLRGAGSTAFSDLLAIEGVRTSFNSININQLSHRSMRPSSSRTRIQMS
jgi:hypothetical protein